MELQVTREASKNDATLGRLYVDGVAECDTLEDVIREVSGQPVSTWKIAEKTAIPVGRYLITFVDSPRFGPNTLSVNGVEGFEDIRIHAGNTAEDTHGCLLVGKRTSDSFISQSKDCLIALKIKLLAAKQRGEVIHIEYLNPVE
jgi:predicted ThiF/HesA family dinucleotide-utilizing enzyme